tara:strand:- start:707 stop:1231 length:525 start_codon:yes stop_codon:yes gene_type:complete
LNNIKQIKKYVIAFGSNLGDRLNNLSTSKSQLLENCPNPYKCIFSSVYETSPVDCTESSGPFLNAVAEMDFDMNPEDVLKMCISIESNLGRPKKREKNSPRHIDLDILYADNVIIEKNNLSIPHPRILSRRFVLEPFAEIKPNLILPGQTKSIIEHLENLKSKEPPLKMIFHKW